MNLCLILNLEITRMITMAFDIPTYITQKDLIAYHLDNDYEVEIEITEYVELYDKHRKKDIRDFVEGVISSFDLISIDAEVNKIIDFIENNPDIISSILAFRFNTVYGVFNQEYIVSICKHFGLNVNGEMNFGNSRNEKMILLDTISPKLREFVEPIFDEVIEKVISYEIEQIKSNYAIWIKE